MPTSSPCAQGPLFYVAFLISDLNVAGWVFAIGFRINLRIFLCKSFIGGLWQCFNVLSARMLAWVHRRERRAPLLSVRNGAGQLSL